MTNQQLLDDAKADNGFEESTRALAVNLAQNLQSYGYAASSKGIKLLADEVIEMDAELTKKRSEMNQGGADKLDAKRWISCADSLPNIADNVLAYRDDDKWQVICFFTTEGRFLIDLDTEAHAITHWMPIPEPPNVRINTSP